MSHVDHASDDLPAYALGCLDEPEARQVAGHLAGCAACRLELDELQRVVDQLGLAAPEAAPAADLRLRLLERVRGPKPKRSLFDWLHPPRLLPIGGLVALALVLILALSNWLSWQRVNNLQMLVGPLGMRAVALQNATAASGSSGFVIISADGENGVLVVDELPTLEAAFEYQLWLVRDGQTTSAAVFTVDEDGYRGMRIEAPNSLLTYSDALVTIEPAGGSPVPTGEEVLGGPLRNP